MSLLGELPDYLDVIRKPVKRLSLRVYEDGRVRLTLPRHCPEGEALAFFHSKADWIEAKRAELSRHCDEPIEFATNRILLHGETYSFEQRSAGRNADVLHQPRCIHNPLDLNQAALRLAWYRHYAKRYLPPRLRAFAQEHELSINKISIRNQRSRWGSCSGKANISLNWRLVLMPEWVSDAVLLHELAHTKEMNHGPDFYALVNRLCPAHDDSGVWLKTHGRQLMMLGQ